MKYAILGGNGVFGVHLSRYLLKHSPGTRVISIGRNPEKSNCFSLHRGIADDRYEYHQVHAVFEHDRLHELLLAKKPDVIVNFAALAADVASSWKYSTRFYETNVVALARTVDFLIGAPWLKRWVQIGSSEIFGAVTQPANEETTPRPSTPYAISKYAGDLHLNVIHKVRDFPMNIVWPSNAYGPGQQLYRIIPRTILACLLNRKLPLQGGGKAVKSFIHAQDLAKAIVLTAEKAPVGASYMIGPKEGTSIRDLVRLTCERAGRQYEDIVEEAPDRLGQDAQYLIDATKIEKELGWKQEISLAEGIDDTVHWAKEYLNDLRPLSNEVIFQA